MKKKWIQLSIFFSGLIGISLLILALTSIGLPSFLRFVSAIIPGELIVTGYEGQFIKSIKAKNIDYRNEDIHISIDDVQLKWQGIRLITGTVDIQSLNAEKLTLEFFKHDTSASEPLNLSHFQSNFFNVLIDKITINTLEINPSALTLNDVQGTLAFNEHGLRLRDIQITHPQGTIQLQANVGPEMGVEIKGLADIASLQEFDSHVTGEMHMLVDVTYDPLQGVGHALLQSKNSRLNGKDFQVDFEADIKDNVLTWENNTFTIGRNQLNTSGVYGTDQKRVTWKIQAKELADISEEMAGSILSEGQYEYINQEWIAQLQLNAQHVFIGPYGVNKLEIKPSSLGTPLKHPMNIQVIADELELPQGIIDQLQIKAQGTTEKHSLSVALNTYNTKLESKGKISFMDDQSFIATLQELSIIFADQSPYVLAHPTQIHWQDEQIKVQPRFFLQGPEQSSISLENIAQQKFVAKLNQIPNQLIARYFTPRFKVTGSVDAQADFTLDGASLDTLQLQATASPMAVIKGKRKQRTFFETGGGQFDLNIDDTVLTSKGHIALINPDQITWDLTVDDWNDLDLAMLKAQFKGSMKNWEPLRLYITETNDFSGNITLDLTAEGKVLEPVFQGALKLSDARLAIPSQGITLQDGNLTISPSDSRDRLLVDGSLTSGKGQLKMTGNLSLKDTWPALDVSLTGDRFLVSNTTKAIVYASPDLQIKTHEKIIDLTGELHIPEAFLNVKGYQASVTPSPDIIIVEEHPEVITPFYQLNTRVLLSLGDTISLKANNLDTGVGGQLQIVQMGDGPLRATGQLHAINGKYAAYGKKLDLSQAVLSFNNSPLDNPGMFIEASRKVQVVQTNNASYLFADPAPQNKSGSVHEGVVGVRITGNVQNPKYTFYSTPPMSEADQLSYLLTGGPSSQVGSAQAAFMFAALSETSGMLGISDTDAARLQSVTQTIGIDFNVESANRIDDNTGQTVTDTNLTVGKEIRPRLYVSYTVGLLDPVNMFRVRYQLSRRWALQSQANTQGDTGGDILYGIESDHFLGMD